MTGRPFPTPQSRSAGGAGRPRGGAVQEQRAQATFDAFSASNRNESVEWLVTARQEVTREKRLLTAIWWITDGKPRYWKYMKEW